MSTTVYAVLDIRGERTSGPRRYGRIVSLHTAAQSAWDALTAEEQRQLGEPDTTYAIPAWSHPGSRARPN